MNTIGWHAVREVVLRTGAVTLLTYIVMRIRGRKQLAQVSTFDLIMVIALGSAVGDVMIYPEDTAQFLRSLIAIATVLVLVEVLERLLALAPRPLAQLALGRPRVLVQNGKLIRKNLQRSQLTEEQLESMLREKDVERYADADRVLLEPDGQISVKRKKED